MTNGSQKQNPLPLALTIHGVVATRTFNGPESNRIFEINKSGLKEDLNNRNFPNLRAYEFGNVTFAFQQGKLTDVDTILFLYIVKKFSEVNTLGMPVKCTKISVTTEEFLKARNLADTRENRKNLKKTLVSSFNRLSGTQMHCVLEANSPYNKTKEDKIIRSVLIQGVEIERGRFVFDLGSNFADYLTHTSLLPLDHSLFKVNARISRAFQTGYQLAVYYRIKSSPAKNKINKEFADKINFAILAEKAGFPTFEQIRSMNRAYLEKIIDPLINALNHLKEIGYLSDYNLCKKNGELLSDQERSELVGSDYANIYIKFELAAAKEFTTMLPTNKPII